MSPNNAAASPAAGAGSVAIAVGCDGAARGEGVPSGSDAPGASVGRDAGIPGVGAAGARGGVGRVSGSSGGNGGGPPGVACVGVMIVSACAGTGLSPARDEAGINTMSTQPCRNLRSRERITFPGSAIRKEVVSRRKM